MKLVMLSVMGFVMVVGLTACNSLPFLSGKAQLETLVGVTVAGVYQVSITKDGKALYSEMWECTKDATTQKLTGCHKVKAGTAVSPEVVPQ